MGSGPSLPLLTTPQEFRICVVEKQIIFTELKKDTVLKTKCVKKSGSNDIGFIKTAKIGELETGNTWTDVDSGSPGPPTDSQKIRQLKNMRLAQDIFDAAMLVQRAKDMK